LKKLIFFFYLDMDNVSEELDELLNLIPTVVPPKFLDTKQPKFAEDCKPAKLTENVIKTATPNVFWATGPAGQQFTDFITSSYAIPKFGFTPLASQVNPASENVMAPIDVRKLLGTGRRYCEGPVDIRNLVGANGGLSAEFQKKSKKENTEKSLSGLPPKLVEIGVSKRLVKLENLNSKPEKELTTTEKDEKENLIRLERKRKAAVVCRERKKRYVRDLEERSRAMSKHLEALEKQNSQLRALLSLGCKGVDLPPPIPRYKHTPFTDKPRVYHRRNIKIDTKRSVLSTMEKLYLSTLYVTPRRLNAMGNLDIPPLCQTNGRGRSKRLRLL